MNSKNKLTLPMALRLAAPHTWVASVYPAIFGILFGIINGYNIGYCQILVILSIILLQSSVNTLNDYSDYVKGTDTAEDNVKPNDSVLVYYNIEPQKVYFLGMVYLISGIILGTLSCIYTGIVPLTIGVIGGVTVIFYSAGPIPLSYLPVGEIVSGLVMGALIPLGTMATIDGQLHFEILLYSLPFILGISLIMMSNNGCDIEKDKLAKRKTLPILIGRRGTSLLFRIITLLWMISIIILSYILLGKSGLAVLVLFIPSFHALTFLYHSELKSKKRIEQMKNIIKLNLIANGSYLITIFLKFLWEAYYV